MIYEINTNKKQPIGSGLSNELAGNTARRSEAQPLSDTIEYNSPYDQEEPTADASPEITTPTTTGEASAPQRPGEYIRSQGLMPYEVTRTDPRTTGRMEQREAEHEQELERLGRQVRIGALGQGLQAIADLFTMRAQNKRDQPFVPVSASRIGANLALSAADQMALENDKFAEDLAGYYQDIFSYEQELQGMENANRQFANELIREDMIAQHQEELQALIDSMGDQFNDHQRFHAEAALRLYSQGNIQLSRWHQDQAGIEIDPETGGITGIRETGEAGQPGSDDYHAIRMEDGTTRPPNPHEQQMFREYQQLEGELQALLSQREAEQEKIRNNQESTYVEGGPLDKRIESLQGWVNDLGSYPAVRDQRLFQGYQQGIQEQERQEQMQQLYQDLSEKASTQGTSSQEYDQLYQDFTPVLGQVHQQQMQENRVFRRQGQEEPTPFNQLPPIDQAIAVHNMSGVRFPDYIAIETMNRIARNTYPEGMNEQQWHQMELQLREMFGETINPETLQAVKRFAGVQEGEVVQRSDSQVQQVSYSDEEVRSIFQNDDFQRFLLESSGLGRGFGIINPRIDGMLTRAADFVVQSPLRATQYLLSIVGEIKEGERQRIMEEYRKWQQEQGNNEPANNIYSNAQ